MNSISQKFGKEIAEIRDVSMGKDVLSPPAHRAFSTPIELLEFVSKLRRLSGGKPVGFKLCVGKRREFLAVCKAMVKTEITPDFITVDGGEGGTGAAPLEFTNHMGAPLIEGLIFVHKAGVCISTLGPGATNLVTAAAYAQLGAMPLLMITGQKPIKSSKQGQFQIVDIVDMMRPLTKYTCQIASGDNIPSRVREAFRIAEEERPGTAHLEFPEDIAAEETRAEIIPKSQVRRPTAEEKAIKRAVEMIERARHPLLLIGAGANRKLTCKMLHRFIDKTGIPFFSTQMGKGVESWAGNRLSSRLDALRRFKRVRAGNWRDTLYHAGYAGRKADGFALQGVLNDS